MTGNFKELLSRPANSFTAPLPIPPGTYIGIIKSQSYGKTRERQTEFARYHIQLIEANDPDISPEDLIGIDFTKRELTKDFYVTEAAAYLLTAFLSSLGIQVAGNLLDSVIPEAIGSNVLVSVVHQPNRKDPTAPPYAAIEDIRPVT